MNYLIDTGIILQHLQTDLKILLFGWQVSIIQRRRGLHTLVTWIYQDDVLFLYVNAILEDYALI